nr:MAG TPA: hypothetical protein [Caudoviricetes sp.]
MPYSLYTRILSVNRIYFQSNFSSLMLVNINFIYYMVLSVVFTKSAYQYRNC